MCRSRLLRRRMVSHSRLILPREDRRIARPASLLNPSFNREDTFHANRRAFVNLDSLPWGPSCSSYSGRCGTANPTMDQIEITPMSVDLVDSFHRALDAVAREQKYLPILEALPVEAMRAFAGNQIKTDALTFAALER